MKRKFLAIIRIKSFDLFIKKKHRGVIDSLPENRLSVVPAHIQSCIITVIDRIQIDVSYHFFSGYIQLRCHDACYVYVFEWNRWQGLGYCCVIEGQSCRARYKPRTTDKVGIIEIRIILFFIFLNKSIILVCIQY